MEGVKNAICVVICSEKMWVCLKCFVCNKDKKNCNQIQSVGGVTNVRMCFCARYMFYCIAEMHGYVYLYGNRCEKQLEIFLFGNWGWLSQEPIQMKI